MWIQSEDDLAALKRVGKAVAAALHEMLRAARPGLATAALDAIGAQVLARHGARPAPKAVYGFPGTACISVNDQAAHGIPGARVIKAGDMVNIDVSAELGGYYADAGATIALRPVSEEAKKLCQCSQSALAKAIGAARAGAGINEIGRAIQAEAARAGLTVIRNLCGHGVGRKLHEYPGHIRNFHFPLDRRRLTKGLVIAIETFLSNGAEYVVAAGDGWTLKTPDGSLAAQCEHTVVVTEGEPIVVTAWH